MEKQIFQYSFLLYLLIFSHVSIIYSINLNSKNNLRGGSQSTLDPAIFQQEYLNFIQSTNQAKISQEENISNTDAIFSNQETDFPGLKDQSDLQLTSLMDADQLMPAYSLYVNTKVNEYIQGDIDFNSIAPKAFDFNFHHKPLMMPYDPKFKVGMGYDIENNEQRASPYILEKLLSGATSSISEEGQDGEIYLTLATSAKELSESLAIEAEAWGSGWGAEVKAKFSFNKQSALKSNEVVLKATHRIDLGKSQINPKEFILSNVAKKTLATSLNNFNQAYGTHYIAGMQMGCKMDINYKKTVKDSDDRMQIAASLKATYSGVSFSGGVSVSADYSTQLKQFSENIDISVQYTGNNNNVFLDGLTIEDLQHAIVEFPANCNGDIWAYILWPYENSWSFAEVKNQVDQYLQFEEDQQFIQTTKAQIATSVKNQAEIDAKLQQQWQEYQNNITQQEEQKKQELEVAISNAENFDSAQALLDQICTQAILEAKIQRVGLEKIQVDPSQQKQKNEDIWELQKWETTLSYLYKAFKKQLNELETAGADYSSMLDMVTEARRQILEKSSDFEETYFKIVCSDKDHCLQCNKYKLNQCEICDKDTILYNDQCVNSCSNGYFKTYQTDQSKNFICNQCNPSCKTCDTTATKCTACNSPKNLYNNNCIDTCPNQYYSTNQVCMQCSSNANCNTYNGCSCTSCKGSDVLKNGQCLTSCGDGWYKGSNSVCSQCDQLCATCSNSATTCQSCTSENYIHVSLNKCAKQCDAGWYSFSKTECQKCSTVNDCIDINSCICNSCSTNTMLYKGACYSSCPSGTKKSGSNCIDLVCNEQCNDEWSSLYDGLWGEWKSPQEYFNQEYYAIGGQMRVEKPIGSGDDTAGNGLKLIFASKNNYNSQITKTIWDGLWGDWGNVVKCPSNEYIIGGKVRFEAYQKGGDDSALNGLQIKCSGGGWLTVHTGSWGDWQGENSKDNSWKVCGGQVRFEDYQQDNDDTAMNGIKFKYCKCQQVCT